MATALQEGVLGGLGLGFRRPVGEDRRFVELLQPSTAPAAHVHRRSDRGTVYRTGSIRRLSVATSILYLYTRSQPAGSRAGNVAESKTADRPVGRRQTGLLPA